jgi:hypothetical protein
MDSHKGAGEQQPFFIVCMQITKKYANFMQIKKPNSPELG